MTIQDMNNRLLEFLNNEPSDGFSLKSDRGLYDYEIERITKFANEFDDTGELALLYLSSACRAQIDDTVSGVSAMLEKPETLKPYRDCLALVESQVVKECRRSMVNSIAKVVASISSRGLIGGAEAIDDALDDAIDAIFDNFSNLKFEVYMRSGRKIGGFPHFSSSVQVCNSLAELLLKLEGSPDGIYVGYVSNPGTLDGWFGFFCKADGNMFSYNERIDEAYAGQHRNMRNGRYAEDKAYGLFPYELCEFSDERDYKGYPKEVKIGDRHRLLDASDFSVFVRTVLCMAIVSRRHAGRTIDGETVIVNSLLSHNLARIDRGGGESTALVKWEGSPLVKACAGYELPMFDVGKVLRGEYDKEFNDAEWPYSGFFNGVNQEIVDAYGEGFKIDQGRILASDSSRRLIGDRETEQEFVGTARRLRLAAYHETRRQLAAYVLKRITDDFNRFGGRDGIKEWYRARLMERMDAILALCADAYGRCGGETHDVVRYGEDEIQDLDDTFKTHNPPMSIFVNKKKELYADVCLSGMADFKRACPVANCRATIHFSFDFSTYGQVRSFLGCDLPKFCVGWFKHPHYNGNSILDVVDPVGEIEHPLHRASFDFSFAISLSRRGLAKGEALRKAARP